MKAASIFEIVAARCWNVLNEGKTFTPVFVAGFFLLFHMQQWHDFFFWLKFGQTFLWMVPLAAVIYHYDFPLHLRKYVWIPLLISIFILQTLPPIGLFITGIGLYFFFTVFFWGTVYYHLRIGTPWNNYRRFWKLVLKNSDSTSGNAQEQIPKILLMLLWMNAFFTESSPITIKYAAFVFFFGLYSAVIHFILFRWKPQELPYTDINQSILQQLPEVSRVFVVIIDGCRKDRLAEAQTPFIDKLQQQGTQFTHMETVYPDRTVVCFSSMFTGTYPREHGIRSNMVWKLGVRCESVFDSLRKVGKCGKMLGIAHLIDAFGDDVESVTAVMKNDEADGQIMKRAKMIMQQQNPDFFIVQLIATDQTGHSRGALYDEYLQKIEEADKHIEQYYRWLEEHGWLEDAVFIVAADHGQSDGIGGHGHLDEGERLVPFIMTGKGVKMGHQVHEPHSLVSLAPTVCSLMRAPIPDKSRGAILKDAFI